MNSKTVSALAVCVSIGAAEARAGDVVDFAASLIGRPYVWGAEGPNSFDCSGLTQYVYQEFGVNLPRRAISQSKTGDPAGRRFQRGDLVFFSTNAGESLVTHVGIYEGSGVMINASKRGGRVRRDDLGDEFWAERFLFARRVVDDVRDTGERVARRRDEEPNRTPSRSSTRRKIAIELLEQIAGTLIRKPR